MQQFNAMRLLLQQIAGRNIEGKYPSAKSLDTLGGAQVYYERIQGDAARIVSGVKEIKLITGKGKVNR